VGILHAPALSVLPALYSKYAAVPLATIGVILMATRILDAVVDPLIGHWSDRTRGRLGARKPWIVAGALLAGISVWFLFRPSAETGALYFLVWSALLYVGWSLIEIPHTAWISDLTRQYDERSQVATYRYLAYTAGGMLFLAVPLLPFYATTEITPETTAAASWIAVLLLPAVVLLAVTRVPNGDNIESAMPSMRSVWNDVRSNGLLWRFLALIAMAGAGSGMVAALYLFFLGSHLGIADKFSYLNLTASACFLIGAPLWLRASYHIGKQRALGLCLMMQALTMIGFALIPPGPSAFPIALVVWALSGLGVSGGTALGVALLADNVDYGAWRSGSAHAGNYFAALSLAQKFSIAAGGGLSLIVVSAFGFDPNIINDDDAMTGFFVAFIWVPFALFLAAAALAFTFPLDRRRHAAILVRLERRRRRTTGDLR
jgi:glycoside/pentoside/hexuronide:cation symporter, GPH family